MFRGATWLALLDGVLACLMLGALLLSGCSGGSGTGGPLESTRAMAAQALQDGGPVASATLATVDAQAGSGGEEQMLESADALTRAGELLSWDYQGLHFEATWQGDPATGAYQRALRVTGTSSEGVAVDLTRALTVDAAADLRTLAISGTLSKDSMVWDVSIWRQRAEVGSVCLLTVNSQIRQNGAEVFARRIMRSMDLDEPEPRQRTQNGTIVVHSLESPGAWLLLTCTDLQYTWDGRSGRPVYQSGTVDLADAAGHTARLVAQNGSLSGTVYDVSGAVVGTLAAGGGRVTVTK